MRYHDDFIARKKRVETWFAPARLGIFYHWGFFTGGGLTSRSRADHVPLFYRSAEEFEAAAPEPEVLADNLVGLALKFGAKYINFTCFHCNGGYAVMFPTKQKEFVLKTKKDFLGAMIEKCHRSGIKLMIYMMMSYHCAETPDGTYLRGIRNQRDMRKLLERLIAEIAERYDKSKIGGFWLDGGFTKPFLDFPAYIKSIFPDAVITVNSCTFQEVKEVDYGTLEFLAQPPVPAYNRPGGATMTNRFGTGVPVDEFIEDIPHCGSWWYWKKQNGTIRENEREYLKDKDFLLHEMISSLGQKGQWNYVIGIPVKIDGSIEKKYHAMFNRVEQFLRWGHEAIYNTRGGLCSSIRPGSFHGGGFCSVTESLEAPNICYILITDPPERSKGGFFMKKNSLYAAFYTKGRVPESVQDLRTGEFLDFAMPGGNGFYLSNIDWNDVRIFGAKVLKVKFA